MSSIFTNCSSDIYKCIGQKDKILKIGITNKNVDLYATNINLSYKGTTLFTKTSDGYKENYANQRVNLYQEEFQEGYFNDWPIGGIVATLVRGA